MNNIELIEQNCCFTQPKNWQGKKKKDWFVFWSCICNFFYILKFLGEKKHFRETAVGEESRSEYCLLAQNTPSLPLLSWESWSRTLSLGISSTLGFHRRVPAVEGHGKAWLGQRAQGTQHHSCLTVCTLKQFLKQLLTSGQAFWKKGRVQVRSQTEAFNRWCTSLAKITTRF